MPPKKLIECTLYIVECSSNVEERLNYLHKLLSVKFFNQTGQDLQRVIFVNNGNSEAINFINDWSLYKLEDLEIFQLETKHSEESSKQSSILNILQAAIDCFEDSLIEPHYIKRIVYITDFSTSLSYSDKINGQIDEIKNELETNNIWLYVVGPKVYVPTIKNQKDILKLSSINPIGQITPTQKENITVLLKIINNNGIVVDFENGFHILFSHKTEVKAPFPWYIHLSIGTDLNLPVVVYKTTRDHQTISYSACSTEPGESSTDKAWFDIYTHDEIPDADVVKGYSFHGKLVTFTADQENEMKEKSFSKSLSIVGFVNSDEISKELYFLPGSMSVVMADERKGESDKNLRLFIQGLRVKNAVALALRVYNDTNAPNLFCLFPCPEHKFESFLMMAQLPYSHAFLERFERGVPCKLEPIKSEIKMYMYGYLDGMTVQNTDLLEEGETLNSLPEHMRLNESRVLECEYFGKRNMGVEPAEPPELKPHPALVERSSEYGHLLAELVVKKSS